MSKNSTLVLFIVRMIIQILSEHRSNDKLKCLSISHSFYNYSFVTLIIAEKAPSYFSQHPIWYKRTWKILLLLINMQPTNPRRKFFFIWEISCIIHVFSEIPLNRKLKKGIGKKEFIIQFPFVVRDSLCSQSLQFNLIWRDFQLHCICTNTLIELALFLTYIIIKMIQHSCHFT